MKQFCIQLLLFLSPVVFFVALGGHVLIATKEYYTTDDVLTLHQTGASYILGKQYIPFDHSYKEAIYRIKQPNYITLGTSHMLVVRQDFFSPADSFYNLTQVADPIAIRDWLKHEIATENHLPSLIVLGIEPYHFVEKNITNGVAEQIERVAQDGIGNINWLQVLSDVMTDVFTRTISLRQLNELAEYDTTVGARAYSRHAGILRDGSYVFPEYSYNNPDSPEYHFAQTMYAVKNGVGLFKTGTIQPETLAAVEEILTLAKAHNITIVGFTTPYSPVVYDYMESIEKFAYIDELNTSLADIFAQHDMVFGDYTNPARLNISNNDFHDGAHYDSGVAATLLLDLATQHPMLGEYLNLAVLRAQAL